MSSFYAYAVLRGGERRISLPRGVLHELPVYCATGALSLVAGRVLRAPRCVPETLAAHEGVVGRLFANARALLPMRFGQLLPDEDSIHRHVEEREKAFEAALDLVAGRVQMTLRLFERNGAEPVLEASDAGPGTAYLRARQQRLSVPELEPLRARLAPHVRAEIVRPSARSPLKAIAYHLVDRADLPAWRAILASQAAAELGSSLVVSGPWPPYAFGEGAER